ncbi:MAG: PKD domain-containing protein, partial [Bacteroidales bacterium]|nr:PKD domain-containing protein [Bacteroidales bacterium]
MNRIYLILPFILFSSLVLSQNEAVIWYFGNQAGLDFSGGSPIALTNSQLYTSEGCSSISDQNGDILFYTNGIVIYAKNHTIMENGTELMGHSSSTQSSLVVPNPSENGIFYIFTADAIENNLVNGLRYSIVDINQNGGLGNVTSKNNLLFAPSCEKITSVKHFNGTDYWVIGHKWNSNEYYTYLVTSAGISEPIINNIGLYHDGNIRNAIGFLKASPLGNKIAAAIETQKQVEILDFDNQTGTLSNSINFTCPNNQRTYGIEFSPNGTKLYVDSWDPGDVIYQFDLQPGTPGGIQSSAVEIYSGGSIQRSAMQLGPDQKIYVARRNKSTIGVISNPDESGLSCNYDDLGVSLNGKTSIFGLPTFIQSNFLSLQQQDFYFEDLCNHDTTFFYITNTYVLDSVFWNFGDPGSGVSNYSSNLNPYHIYNDAGSYEVTLISYFSTNIDTVYKNININPSPLINLGNDTLVCSNNSFLLDAGSGYNNYLWQDSSINSNFTVDTTGLYWVIVSNEFGCTNVDSIFVELYPNPTIDLGNDTLICTGDNLILNAGSGYISYLWSNGSTDTSIVVDTSAIYWVEVENEFGCSAIDSILVEIYPMAFEELELGPDSIFCPGTNFVLNAGSGYTFYQWQDGSSDSIFIADNAGVYWVYVENPCSYGSDTIVLDNYPQTVIDLGNDTAVCHDESILLDPGFGFLSYLWQDGSSNQFLYTNQTGSYWVQVMDDNSCYVYDTIDLEFVLPDPDIGSDTAICSGDSVTFQTSNAFVNYLWQNGSDQLNFTANSEGLIWCEVVDTLGCVGSDSVFLEILFPPVISLGNDTAFCVGDSLWLFAYPWNNEYDIFWQDGSSDSACLVWQEGEYWVMATNVCGTSTDSILISVDQLPWVFIGNDTILAMNSQIELNAGNGFENYLWSDGSEIQTLSITEGGSYWVNVFDGQCY